MFKQLKKKMMTLNLAILTVLLLIVLVSSYISSYQQIQNRINSDLQRVISNDSFQQPLDNPDPGNLFPVKEVAFVIVTDLGGNILDFHSFFEEEDSFYTDAYALIDTKDGNISYDGNIWEYDSKIYNNVIIYGFVDITNDSEYLTNMLYTYIIIFISAFIAVAVISSFITNRSIQKIKEAFTKQKQFIANASHELKTPLAIINTNTDILLEKDKDNKWLNDISFETDRMNNLTKDLLYLTKMSEQGPEEIIRSRVNFSQLAESSILTFEALAYTKNIDITYNINPEIFVEADESQFSQVFHILLDNAIKYTRENGKIHAKLEIQHNSVVFQLDNTGEGINPVDLPNIFDRFYKGDKSRSQNEKSYGLGLSIAKKIVENHQGKITCESIPEQTTSFIIKIKNKYT